MGVESVSVTDALFHALMKSLVILLEETKLIPFSCYQLWNPGNKRTYTSYRRYATNVYMQNHGSSPLKLYGKTTQT